MRITPDNIQSLNANEYFVFGSNLQGIHAGGAAKLAYDKFGARWTQEIGQHGQSYAIPTMDLLAYESLHISVIKVAVGVFLEHVRKNPQNIFLVTEIGCGIAGYKPDDIAPLFLEASKLENISLPLSFRKILKQVV